VPAGCQKLADVAGVRIKGDASLVIGTFKHADGVRWVMVVNRDFRQVALAALQFVDSSAAVQELRPADGHLVPATMQAGGVPLDLPPGRARLFRLAK
jgi:hypothetical protein